MDLVAGSTDVSTYWSLELADGTAATGLDVTTFDLQYTRSGAAPAAKVDATALATTSSAHADNKAIEVDSVTSQGLYRIDWPDAAFAAGVREVTLAVKVPGCKMAFGSVNLTPVPAQLSASERTAAADALLARNGAGGSDGGRTVADYVQGALPKVVVSTDGLTYTVYGADGTTPVDTGDMTRLSTAVGGPKTVTPD